MPTARSSTQIFTGGLEALREAGVALLGGHTVMDQEIKFGYAVTGEVDPSRVWTNAGAQVGDRLFLTKRIGTGVITTAIKFSRAPQSGGRRGDRLDGAAEPRGRRGPGATAGRRRARVHRRDRIRPDAATGRKWRRRAVSSSRSTSRRSRSWKGRSTWSSRTRRAGDGPICSTSAGGVAPGRTAWIHARVQMLFDPQTSGGLLVAIAPGGGGRGRSALARAGVTAHPVGDRVRKAQDNNGRQVKRLP